MAFPHASLPDPDDEAMARKLAAETLCDLRTCRKFVSGYSIKGLGIRQRLEAAKKRFSAPEPLSATGT